MNKDSRVLIAGSNGMVGSAIVRNLVNNGYTNIIQATRQDVDFTNQVETETYFCSVEPEYVVLAAAKVGGILANKTQKAEFIYDNLMIQSNIIHNAYNYGVKKLLFLGSSCIYPKYCDLPIKEDYLMTGALEPTNDSYAVAKIAGIKMCQSYNEQYGFNAISAMPCNLYGINDNFHPENSHVLPGLIRRFHEAKEQNLSTVTCWGDGSPMREFLFVDDLADACVYLMNNYLDSQKIVNVGTGTEISIRELAELIADIVGYTGHIMWDTSKPNGTMRKVMDVSRIKETGWEPKVGIREGIQRTYEWFKENYQ